MQLPRPQSWAFGKDFASSELTNANLYLLNAAMTSTTRSRLFLWNRITPVWYPTVGFFVSAKTRITYVQGVRAHPPR